MNNEKETGGQSRRDFLKKLAYMPPAIATLTVLPAFQASGSGLTRPNGGNPHPNFPGRGNDRNNRNNNRSWGRSWNRRRDND